MIVTTGSTARCGFYIIIYHLTSRNASAYLRDTLLRSSFSPPGDLFYWDQVTSLTCGNSEQTRINELTWIGFVFTNQNKRCRFLTEILQWKNAGVEFWSTDFPTNISNILQPYLPYSALSVLWQTITVFYAKIDVISATLPSLLEKSGDWKLKC